MAPNRKPGQQPQVVTLKEVAHHLGLTPGTVSAVLNDAPSARSIPQETKNRIHAGAKELNYRPNFFARSLRNKRTYTIGVIVAEIGDTYGAAVVRGVEVFITVDTTIHEMPTLPTVAVAGHKKLKGVTNIVLDHHRAAFLALSHLKDLSHERIAVLRGHPLSADSDDRFNAICEVAEQLGIGIDSELTVHIDLDDPN